SKIKYRPVIFELMPPEFTLTELQGTVEAIAGHHVHKQNFRRLVDGAELVEPTGSTQAATGGRPAALFRFRRQVLEERPAPGLKVGGRTSG
ncbi:MAG: NUDIX hydrolase, partial [Allorhizobium sp.]